MQELLDENKKNLAEVKKHGLNYILIEDEYNVDIIREGLPYQFIRWITSEKHIAGGMDELNKLVLTSDTKLIQDVKGNYLLIFTSEWNIKWALDKNEGLELAEFNRD